MEVSHTLDIILTVVVLSFWFLFPIGMFLSVSSLDENTDQLARLKSEKHEKRHFRPGKNQMKMRAAQEVPKTKLLAQ